MLVQLKLLDQFANKKLMILGLGREGVSTYQFLREYGPNSIQFVLADSRTLSELNSFWQSEVDQDKASYTQLTEQTIDWAGIDVVSVTPGISNRVLTKKYGLPSTVTVTTNTTLFFELAATAPRDQLVTIGVTGTKGKSTTTAAIHHVLHESGQLSALGGNIGVPPLDVIKQLFVLEGKKHEYYGMPTIFAVLELSCHQLSRVHHSPNIAVVQAVTPEHLDYYLNFEEYIEAKKAICRYQTKRDLVYFNAESITAQEIAELSPAAKHGFSLKKSPVDPEKMLIPGKHNVLNVMPAILIAQKEGIQLEDALEKVYSFTGLPHRLQLVAEQKISPNNSIRYYNDSLSTTPEAAIAAVDSFENSVVLIAGGYDRGLEYAELGGFLARAALGNKLRGLVYFAPSGGRIADAIMMYDPTLIVPMIEVETMAEAVAEAKELAEPGDIVLLSPASASFGRFKDYADRGEQFSQEAQKSVTS